MCFSPEASFAGGAIITVIGIASLRKAEKTSQLPFASIPLVFGVQQFSEGFVWLSLQSPQPPPGLTLPSMVFLIMALVIWPTMVPFAILRMEESEKKRKMLKFLLAGGVITSCYYGAGLVIFNVNPEISSHHIRYVNDFPSTLTMPVFFLYLVATLTPFFVSSVKRMPYMGILMVVSCFITGICYEEYLTSVWCFFAALTSGVIYWVLSESPVTVKAGHLPLIKIPDTWKDWPNWLR
ncbi:MAG: hypothetical protein MUP53_07660 [Bacteroidales bacterium]|nr:hypothetical protein [Bacteroidales bacterium]